MNTHLLLKLLILRQVLKLFNGSQSMLDLIKKTIFELNVYFTSI